MNEWVRLTSSDGYDYLVKRKAAMCSGTLRNMLSAESGFSIAFSVPYIRHQLTRKSGSFSEAISNTCSMSER